MSVDASVGSAHPEPLRFGLLGGLTITTGGRAVDLPAPKQRLLLAVLLLERARVVSVDRLLELLWPDGSDKALASLQASVSRLRTVLEPQRRPRDPARLLVSQPPGYRLAVDRSQVDALRFEDEVGRGLDALRQGDHHTARSVLDGALAGWTGPLLPEFADEPFVIAAGRRLDDLRLSAVEGAAEARLALGDPAGALAVLDDEAAGHPLRERLHGLLALALYRGGRQADALRVIDRCRRALADAAGLDLGAELRRLEQDVLAQAPSLDGPTRAAAPAAPSPAPTSAAPAPTGPATRPVVGREREIAELDDAIAAAAAGRGGVAVIVGEPGIGKTRLAELVVERAGHRGATTAWARCPDSRSTPPFWALSQLTDRLPGRTPLEPASGDRDRFEHSRAVLKALDGSGEFVVAVIDDLQWADPDSLRLLALIAPDLPSTRVLLVVTMRPLSDDSPEALVDCVAEIARGAGTVDVPLQGLAAAEVADWLATRAAAPASDGMAEVAGLIHERTAGNPLFIKELIDLLATEGRLDDVDAARTTRTIPTGVQFVVRRRVSRLPRATQQLLLVAAVLGPAFELDTVAAAAGVAAAGALDALGPALDAGLLAESGGEFRFSHALVADALADEVNAARRATIHAAAARSLVERAGPGFGLRAAAIAHHAREGVLAGTGALAVEAGTRAAEIAAGRFAFEDAADHWADVAQVLARSRPGDVAAHVEALTQQARSLVLADMVLAAKVPILAAVAAAEAAGLTGAMATALSLFNNTHVWNNEAYGVVDTQVVNALERTIERLEREGGTGEQRAILLGALAAELAFAGRERHEAACEAAEAAARATGDPAVIARVLNNTMAINRPHTLARRAAAAEEILALVDAHDLGPDLRFVGHFHRAEAHVERAEFAAAAHHVHRSRQVLHSLPATRLHGQQNWLEAALAVAAGRYDEAAEFAAAAHELHRRGRVYDADAINLAGRLAVLLDRGGLEDMLPFFTSVTNEGGYDRITAEAMAFAMLELGRVDLARATTASFGPSAGWPDDYTTLCTATAALHVRVELGDATGAAPAAAVLAPYPDRWAAVGTSPLSLGPVALALGRHAAAVGDLDAARRHLAAAVELTERAGAPAWLARSLVHQGSFLAGLGEGDEARVAHRRARDLAVRHGLPYVARRLDAFGA